MTADRARWFVSSEWLAAHLGDPYVVVLDGSWHLAASGRNSHFMGSPWPVVRGPWQRSYRRPRKPTLPR